MQFRKNRNELNELDDTAVDDDGDTEWQKFLTSCLEIIAKIADFEPMEILRLVVSIFLDEAGNLSVLKLVLKWYQLFGHFP